MSKENNSRGTRDGNLPLIEGNRGHSHVLHVVRFLFCCQVDCSSPRTDSRVGCLADFLASWMARAHLFGKASCSYRAVQSCPFWVALFLSHGINVPVEIRGLLLPGSPAFITVCPVGHVFRNASLTKASPADKYPDKRSLGGTRPSL